MTEWFVPSEYKMFLEWCEGYGSPFALLGEGGQAVYQSFWNWVKAKGYLESERKAVGKRAFTFQSVRKYAHYWFIWLLLARNPIPTQAEIKSQIDLAFLEYGVEGFQKGEIDLSTPRTVRDLYLNWYKPAMAEHGFPPSSQKTFERYVKLIRQQRRK